MKRVFLVWLVIAASGATLVADNPQQAFARRWVGRTVTVRAPIYSLVYNERGRLGSSRQGLREGLTVATASGAAYLQFDGRQGRDTVVQQDPRMVLAAVNAAYQGDALDVRSYRKLEALSVARHDPGAALVVTGARLDHNLVRIDLATGPGRRPITALRIKWPVPLSPSFEEREVVEAVIGKFIAVEQP